MKFNHIPFVAFFQIYQMISKFIVLVLQVQKITQGMVIYMNQIQIVQGDSEHYVSQNWDIFLCSV